MTYLSGRSKTRKKYINASLGLVAFALFIYFWPLVRTVSYPIVLPLVHAYKSTKDTVTFLPASISTYFSSRKTLAARNAELEITIERLENQLAQKDALLRNDTEVSRASAGSSTNPVIVLYPIAEDVTRLYSTILLSKGYKDGLEKGGLVYIRGQQAVCETVEVYTTTSLCELLSKGGRVTEGVAPGPGITLTLVGSGGGNFIADMPKAGGLSIGEAVYLRSNPSLLLGTIVSIKSDEQSTEAKIYVRGAYNPVTSQVFYMNSKYAP
jgi:hypothetical protein